LEGSAKVTLDELRVYLANVVFIVRSDGQISPKEQVYLDDAASAVGAKKKDINEAQKLAEQADYCPTPVGRLSDRIRNVEDMFYVALADGVLASRERDAIWAFAQATGLTSEQTQQLAAATERQLTAEPESVSCPKCAAKAVAGSKFCPECGSPFLPTGTAGAVKLEFCYPKTGLAIEFPESTAVTFDAALKAARAAPGFQEAERAKKKWFLASWPADKTLNALELVANLKGMRNRKAYVDGSEVPWDAAFGFAWCYQKRKAAYNKVEYCFGAEQKTPNLYGCCLLGMDWTPWSKWLSYGKYVAKDMFAFDKDRLRHELDGALSRVRLCPHLHPKLVDAVFSRLPERAWVGKEREWRYKESFQETPGSVKIVERKGDGEFSYTREFFSDGVAPSGFKLAKGILQDALRSCGMSDVDVQQILP